MTRAILVAAILIVNIPAYAATLEVETSENGVKSSWSITYVNGAGVMRVDEGSWVASVSAPAAGSIQSSTVTYTRGRIQDTIIYNPDADEILSVEGEICRVLSADSAPPPGMGFMNSPEMQAQRQQMGSAAADAIKQMEQSGASPQQIQAMKDMMGTLDIPGMEPPEPPSNDIQLVDGNVTVGDYTGRRYSISDSTGTELYRVVLASVDDLPGGQQARDGMEGMMALFEEYMQGAGLPTAGLVGGLTEFMTDQQFASDYPLQVEDLQRGTVSTVILASDDIAAVEFDPECERQDMTGF